MQFYTYGNIVRILDIDEVHPEKSRMIDVNMDEKIILSNFDATRPFDAAFIKSFQNILSNSSTGFKIQNDRDTQEDALAIVSLHKFI